MRRSCIFLLLFAIGATARGQAFPAPSQTIDCKLDPLTENGTGISCTGIEWPPSKKDTARPPSGKVSVAELISRKSKEERERVLAVGKRLFVERCSKCHDQRGDKPLKTGPPLSQRELSDTELTRAVSGRFRDKSDEEKRAVMLYIRNLMKRK